MSKTSSISFVSLVASIIIFSLFLNIFPNGIKIAKPFQIEYEGPFRFFGKIEGNGNVSIKVYNYTLEGNLSMSGYFLEISGQISFWCEGEMKHEVNNNVIKTNKTRFYADKCLINGELYKNIHGNITGDITINFDGEAILKEGKQEKELFLFPMKFNKIFLMENGGKIFINGKEKNFTDYVLFRGDGEISSKLKATGYILAIDGKFLDESKKLYFFPTKIIILWAIAIAMLIISLFLKKDLFGEKDKIFYGFSIIISLLFFAISFYLWNCEIERISGFNLLDISNIKGLKSILVLSFAIVPYIIAIGTVGLPLRVIISSFFEIFGLTNIGKGIGRMVGFMFTIIWGLSLFQFILNITLSPLLRLL